MKTCRSIFVLLVLSLIILLSSCNKEEESNPVAPTSKFVGKWKTETPVLVKLKTDFCTGTLEDVATMEWVIYWDVEETQDPKL